MLADAPTCAAAAGIAATAKDMKKRYGIQEIPVVYLIDSTGTITHAHVGFKEEHIAELDAAVKAILGGAGAVKRRLPWVLLALSLVLMAAGLLLGEYRTVLEKAITVCLDCIGIG